MSGNLLLDTHYCVTIRKFHLIATAMREACLLFWTLVSIIAQFSLETKANSSGEDLKQQHQDAVIERQNEKTNCAKVQQDFQAYDLYGVSAGRALYGLDLWGKVWIIERRQGPKCALKKIARLGIQASGEDIYGDPIYRTFYYESKMLCEYSRFVIGSDVRKRCYAPLGIVNKFAPYFSH